jgi:hypothetical protein
MIPGGETAATAWFEARSSFVSGNFIATILLAQGLAEHVLAAEVSMGLSEVELPKRISFSQTLELCAERGFLPDLSTRNCRNDNIRTATPIANAASTRDVHHYLTNKVPCPPSTASRTATP